jgi:hypothetical protein
MSEVRRMTHLRRESLERVLLLLAEHADAWPALWEQHPALLSYLARHGAWHLARVGRVPEAIAFLGRLLAFEAREALLTPSQQSATLLDGLVAVGLCPPEREDEVEGTALAALLLSVQDRSLLRAGCALLAGRPLDALGEAFAEDPNPSSAVAYVLAEELARRVLAEDDQEAWQALAEVGGDNDHAIQYTALYAFKYVASARPEWLTPAILGPFATGGPYERLAVTTLLLYLALQGDPFPTRFDVPEFWRPRWAYNKEEIVFLKGAMAFRGLTGTEADDPDVAESAEKYRETERRCAACLARLGQGDALLRGILGDYWRLTSRLDDLGRLRAGLRHHPEAEEFLWLLMVSPFWEAVEAGSALLARFAALDDAWAARALAWATEDDQTTWWGALVALRLLAARTGREEALFAALRVQSTHGSAQLLGNCGNTLHTLILAASPSRRTSLLEAFGEELRGLLHGEDVWAVHEVLMLLEGLEDAREDLAVRWDADQAPLLAHTPDWRDLSATQWGDIIHARLHGEASTLTDSR